MYVPGETPKVGERCRIELNAVAVGQQTTLTTTYEGAVAKVSPEGVGLRVKESRQTKVRKTPLARAPFVSRFLRNVGIGRPAPGEEKEVELVELAGERVVLGHKGRGNK